MLSYTLGLFQKETEAEGGVRKTQGRGGEDVPGKEAKTVPVTDERTGRPAPAAIVGEITERAEHEILVVQNL